MTDTFNEYPCAPIDGVHPAFVPGMILQHMALRYMRRVPDLSLDEALDAAVATWGTDWDSDPQPRTFKHAEEAVDGDLECWDD